MRVNQLYIVEKAAPIRGRWIVDPCLLIPPGLLPAVKSKKRMDNLRLYSRNKPVQAILALLSETKSKSFLSMQSKFGAVTVDITTRTNQRFSLNAESKRNDVTIYLPRGFEGPVTFKYKRFPPEFSEEVRSRLTLFGRDCKHGTAFIGDWSKFGDGRPGKDGRYEHWDGDELVMSSKSGVIRVAYTDEPREEQKPPPGLLRKLIGY